MSKLWFLLIWVSLVIPSVLIVSYDIKHNQGNLGLMKYVWVLTTVYSGIIGLVIYWKTGRKQISHDSIWKKSWRSVAHCYSGCGAGEITALILTIGVLSITDSIIIATTSFTFAYSFGLFLTVGPLIQDGLSIKRAILDGIYSETASITTMEIVAISIDLYLGGTSGLHTPEFWFALIIALSCGLFAAYPVNVLLINFGVKEGMMNPKMMD